MFNCVNVKAKLLPLSYGRLKPSIVCKSEQIVSISYHFQLDVEKQTTKMCALTFAKRG